LTQDPVLPPQTVELSPLVTIKPGPGAASDVRAFHPLPERVAAHAQLVSYLLQRPPALAEQPYRLDLELKRVGRISGSSLHGQSFPSNLAQAGICPPKRGNSSGVLALQRLEADLVQNEQVSPKQCGVQDAQPVLLPRCARFVDEVVKGKEVDPVPVLDR